MSNLLNSTALKLAYSYLNANPEKNIPKLLGWLDRFDRKDALKGTRDAIRKVVEEGDNNWYRLILSLWPDLDAGVRRTLFNNFVINENIIGAPVQEENRKKYGCNIPWAILMDPTSACNLKCTGCWAAEYGHQMSMSYETLDNIIRQGKELGVYFYIYSGGEPLVRKKDIIRLCEKHADCAFLAFTNGTLIDEAFADEMLRVKNFVPAISIEGFEEATDSRRGKGTFRSVIRAMEILKSKKLGFGASLCYTRANTEVIGSEKFFDFLVGQGVKFAWFFTYMPVGADAVPDLMVTADQREFMYRQVRQFRQRRNRALRVHPLFRLKYLRQNAAGGAPRAAVYAIPRQPALQRKPPAPLPTVGQSGQAYGNGGKVGCRFDGFHQARGRPHPQRQMQVRRGQLGGHRRQALGRKARLRSLPQMPSRSRR